MGTYNTLHMRLVCPRCAEAVDAEITCHFGDTANLVDLSLGDAYPWRPRQSPRHGGRPAGGDVDGEGYLECPLCAKDAFFQVQVRGDIVTGVVPDPDKAGYIAD